MRIQHFLLIICALGLALASPLREASAHEVEVGPHGGPVTDARDHHIELVLTADAISVYVTGPDDSSVALEEATGRAIVLAERSLSRLDLTPTAEALTGSVDISGEGPFTIVVTVNLAEKEPMQARFKLDKLITNVTSTQEQTSVHTDHNGHSGKTADAGHHGGGHHGASSIHLAALVEGGFEAGEIRPVTLTFRDKATGAGLGPDDLVIAHTQKVHLLIIDPSLDDYHHIHPTPGAEPGEWVFDFTPAHDRAYRLWADVVRSDTGQQEYVRIDLNGETQNAPEPSRETVLDITNDGFDWTLLLDKPLRLGEASLAEITIQKDGVPFDALEPVIGAYAHMVGFADDYETIAHVHPMGRKPASAAERGGPTLRFHVTPEKAGLLRLWAQVQIDGEQVFAPFTVTVAE